MYFYLKEIINRFLISVSCFVKLYLKPRIPALTNNECPPGKKSGYMDCCKKNTITTHCPFIIFLWRWILLPISHFPKLDEFKSQGKSSKSQGKSSKSQGKSSKSQGKSSKISLKSQGKVGTLCHYPMSRQQLKTGKG